jgi:hypothetical protein
MNRPIHFALLVAFAAAVGVGCGKKESTPAAIPIPSGDPATVTSGGTTDPPATPPPVTPPPVATAPVSHGSIDACCAALSAIERSGKEAATKKKAAMAAKVCPGIAARVKSGQVPRAEALAQILSALAGSSAPGECH